MNNIINSLKLDYSLIKPYIKTICISLVFSLVFVALNRSLLTGISFAMCLAAMTTSYLFSVTEKNNMERLYGLLPVSKASLVLGRYLYMILTGAVILIFSIIMQTIILKLLKENINFNDIFFAFAVGAVLFALFTIFQLPGFYKLGSIKGRLFMYIPMLGFFASSIIIAKYNISLAPLISDNGSIIMLLILIFAAIAIMYIISIIISINIVKNKEF